MDSDDLKFWQRVEILAGQGMTAAEAARQLGVTKGAVWGAAKYYRIQFRPFTYALQELRGLAEQGLTAREAAERLNVSVDSVYIRARRAKIKLRQVKGPCSPDTMALVKRMRRAAKTMTLQEFSRAEGCKHSGYISEKAKAAGIEFQPRQTVWRRLEVQSVAGLTLSQAARVLGIPVQLAWSEARRKNITFRKKTDSAQVAA